MTLGCRVCGAPTGTLHTPVCNYGGSYVRWEEAEELPVTTAAATAVTKHLDGAYIPEAGTSSPLRRVELAAIWLAEAQAELNDAIIAAGDDQRITWRDIGRAQGVTGEAVRQRYWRLLGHRAVDGRS